MKKYLLSLIAILTAGTAIAGGVEPEKKIFIVNTIEGVPMSFRVTSEERNTCEVYAEEAVEYNGETYYETTTAIPKNTTGTVTIPEWANDYSVEEIGDGAFKGCYQLTNVIIPEGITWINWEAFYDCRGLTTISLPESLSIIGRSAFEGCTGLQSIVIPNNCQEVEDGAFEGCVSLSSVVLSESLKTIERSTFEDCISLASITLPENLQELESDAFQNCYLLASFHIPASVNRIIGNPVRGCKALASITVASGNTIYDSRENCNAIVETAQNRLIAGCKNTVIPEGITSMGSSAFEGCRGMTTLHIPASLVEGLYNGNDNYFSGISTDLTMITVAEGNPVYDSRNNCNAIIETATNTLFLGCRTTIIPQGVTTIGHGAFYRCVSLTTMNIPNSVASIEKRAFSETGLTSINIPSSVKTIGDNVFENCLNLTSITLSEGLESIGNECFDYCGITSLTIPASVTQIGSSSSSGSKLYESCPPKLESINVAKGNTVYDSREDCNAIIETSTNTLINGCKNTVIPEGVSAIGKYALCYCTGLKSLTIPKSVRKIESSAFRYCYNLESISVTRGNNYYDSRSNCNAIIDIAKKELILGCKNTVIPQNITKISGYAFALCPITTITIPANITSIGSSSFYGCTKMESVTSLIEEPFEVNRSTFQSYEGLGKLFDENGLTLTLEEIASIDDDIFYGEKTYLHENMPLYVPKGTKAKYEATSCWNEFKEIIEIGSSDIKESIGDSNQEQKTNVWYSVDGAKFNGKPQKKGIYIHQGEKYVIK